MNYQLFAIFPSQKPFFRAKNRLFPSESSFSTHFFSILTDPKEVTFRGETHKVEKTFAKILHEKLTQKLTEKHHLSASSALKSGSLDSATTLEPSSLTNLLGRMNPTHFKPGHQRVKAFTRAHLTAQAHAAAQKTTSQTLAAEPKTEVKIPSPPRRPKHNLTLQQTQSWAYFHDHTGLLNGFFESELKQAFHSLAKMMHPDRGGDSQLFRELKSHYDRLKILFY